MEYLGLLKSKDLIQGNKDYGFLLLLNFCRELSVLHIFCDVMLRCSCEEVLDEGTIFFIKYLLTAYHVPDIVQDIGSSANGLRHVFCLQSDREDHQPIHGKNIICNK